MSDFLVFFETGLRHVLDLDGYDHVLFLIVLALPYGLRDWKPLLWQVSLFTIGHTFSLVLAALGWINIRPASIEFLIPVTIILTAGFRLARPSENSRGTIWWITLLFGIVHGLGFSNYFNSILGGSPAEKTVPLASFAFGIELAQFAVVAALLLLEFGASKVIRCSRRDFNLAVSAIVIGLTLPILSQKTSELINI